MAHVFVLDPLSLISALHTFFSVPSVLRNRCRFQRCLIRSPRKPRRSLPKSSATAPPPANSASRHQNNPYPPRTRAPFARHPPLATRHCPTSLPLPSTIPYARESPG